jgi:hypothetical protein
MSGISDMNIDFDIDKLCRVITPSAEQLWDKTPRSENDDKLWDKTPSTTSPNSPNTDSDSDSDSSTPNIIYRIEDNILKEIIHYYEKYVEENIKNKRHNPFLTALVCVLRKYSVFKLLSEYVKYFSDIDAEDISNDTYHFLKSFNGWYVVESSKKKPRFIKSQFL